MTGYYQTGRSRWAAAYALSLALALYVEISAVFALAPRVLVLAWLARQRARRALVLVGVGMVGTLAFVPWLPRLLQVAAPESTHAQFALTPDKVRSSLLAVTGLGGNADYFLSAQPTAWDRWSQWG